MASRTTQPFPRYLAYQEWFGPVSIAVLFANSVITAYSRDYCILLWNAAYSRNFVETFFIYFRHQNVTKRLRENNQELINKGKNKKKKKLCAGHTDDQSLGRKLIYA